ncbi:MAG: hypothetical protein AAGA48_40365 [Myxococcota bacterium]
MWMLLVSVAGAEPCEVLIDAEAWRWQLQRAAEQLSGRNIAGGQATLNSAKNRATCLATRADPADLALLARLEAVSAFFKQELDQVDDWSKLAAITAPMSEYPGWLNAQHPVRSYLDRPPPGWSGWPEQSVAAPKKGGVFLNGVWLDRPLFPTSTPCLIQILNKSGERVDAWWQHGAAAPPGQLEPIDEVAERPRFYEGPAISERAG